MAARIGIDLSAGTCRIVELAAPFWRGRRDARVKKFASLALSDPESTERFAALRGRHASVVIWTPHSTHRPVIVDDGPYDRMHTEALAASGVVGPATPPVLSDIAPAAGHVPGQERRLIVASVPRTEAADVLRPLKDAGIGIDAVLTPAAALTSLARLGGGSTEGILEAYIALAETASTIAIVRDGCLLAARTVPWGYLNEPSAHTVVRAREEIVQRLASELSMCMASGQLKGIPLAQIRMCGALPELRTMAVSLTEWLDLEVEALDGLFGIDARKLPEPVEEFRERAAELRLAWAAAADRHPVLNLFRERERRARRGTSSDAVYPATSRVVCGV
jgi:hypothetical protein